MPWIKIKEYSTEVVRIWVLYTDDEKKKKLEVVVRQNDVRISYTNSDLKKSPLSEDIAKTLKSWDLNPEYRIGYSDYISMTSNKSQKDKILDFIDVLTDYDLSILEIRDEIYEKIGVVKREHISPYQQALLKDYLSFPLSDITDLTDKDLALRTLRSIRNGFLSDEDKKLLFENE